MGSLCEYGCHTHCPVFFLTQPGRVMVPGVPRLVLLGLAVVPLLGAEQVLGSLGLRPWALYVSDSGPPVGL